jgi:hypothetical protein
VVPRDAEPLDDGGGGDVASLGRVIATIWSTLVALFCSGCIGILIFPFFTYVPSGGLLGEMLPKVRRRRRASGARARAGRPG